jgi:hypothetical protein
MIHHLSYPFKGDSINASVIDEPFTLSTVSDAGRSFVAAGRGCFLKLDVEAAYRQVPIRREDWPLLGFKWLGKWYYERCLPFGLKPSCRLWELYAAALHFFFERVGAPVVIHYIDDFLFVVKSEREAQSLLERALALCVELGIPMAAEKTEGPTTCPMFLSIQLDNLQLRASLPEPKLLEIQRLTTDWIDKTHTNVKDCEKLAGILNFASAVVRPGRFCCDSSLSGPSQSTCIDASQVSSRCAEPTRSVTDGHAVMV